MTKATHFRSYVEAYDKVTSAVRAYRELIRLHAQELRGYDMILESCCGPGELAIQLAKEGHIVDAFDGNREAIDRLTKKIESDQNIKRKLTTYCFQAPVLPFADRYFNGVSSMLALPFMEKPIEYLKENKRVLRSGGRLIVSGPDKASRDDVDEILAKWKSDIEEQGLLSQLSSFWDLFEQRTRQARELVVNWYEREEAVKVLEKQIGLCVVKSLPNPIYFGRVMQ